MIAPSRALRALSLAVLAAPLVARAGDLEVSPILVELSSGARSALVTIRNTGRRTVRYQARAFGWAQERDGAMVLEPAKDLFLFPPLVELQPGESRNLRLGTDAAPGERERSWRLFVEELPRADAAPAANQVQVLTRVGVPVFLAPKVRTVKAELAFLPREGPRVRFVLRNAGTVHLRPRSVTFALEAKGGERVLERSLDAWYVLAGGERVYEADVPAAACARAAEGVVVAVLDEGDIEAREAGLCRAP